MASSLGVSITIGAVLAGSVAAAFGSVSKRLGSFDAKIAATAKKSSVLSKALDLAAKKAELEARVNMGERGLEQELARVTAQYNRAVQAASQYGQIPLCH